MGVCPLLRFCMQSHAIHSLLYTLFSFSPSPPFTPFHFPPILFLFISLPYHSPFLFISVFLYVLRSPFNTFSFGNFLSNPVWDGVSFSLGENFFPGTKFCLPQRCSVGILCNQAYVYWYVNSYVLLKWKYLTLHFCKYFANFNE